MMLLQMSSLGWAYGASNSIERLITKEHFYYKHSGDCEPCRLFALYTSLNRIESPSEKLRCRGRVAKLLTHRTSLPISKLCSHVAADDDNDDGPSEWEKVPAKAQSKWCEQSAHFPLLNLKPAFALSIHSLKKVGKQRRRWVKSDEK